MGSSKSSKQTVGYKYYLGAHMALCHGPVDAITKIRVEDRVAWSSDERIEGTIDNASFSGNGPGDLSDVSATEEAVDETWTVTCTSTGSGYLLSTWSVVGSVSGDRGTAQEGQTYSNNRLQFTIDSSITGPVGGAGGGGSVESGYSVGDTFEIDVSAGGTYGDVTGNETIDVDKPELFGGESREGGISGAVDVAMGRANQSPNGYLQSVLPGIVPAFRGVCAIVLRQVYVGINPYLKPWSVTLRRILERSDGKPQWYPERAELSNGDMNPAHILRECITNTSWGMGEPEGEVDNVAFTLAADQLWEEDFGLSLLWQQDQEFRDFIAEVTRHINASLYTDPSTGLWTLRLIRDDYTYEDLPRFDESNLASLSDWSRPSWGELVNQMTVAYTDREAGKMRSVTVHDMAAIERQGSVVAATEQYQGITRAELASRVAGRELRERSSPLAGCTVVGNREAGELRLGDALRLSWSALGIEDVVMRVAEADYGNLTDGRVTLSLVEDVFAAGVAVYAEPPPTGWQPPVTRPSPAPVRKVVEAPYWTVVQELTGESETALADLDDDAGFLTTLATRPSGDAINYETHVDPGGGYDQEGNGDWTPTATISADVPAEVQTTVGYAGADAIDDVEVDTFAWLGDEAVAVRSIDQLNGTVTLDRGVLDTVPVAHPVGTRLWFAGTDAGVITTQYVAGETIDVRLLPVTGRGQLDLDKAPTNTLELDARLWRPYPPGNFRINGQRWPAQISGGLSVSWAHRDRTQQTSELTPQDDGNIGPEPGTDYTVRIMDRDADAVLHEETLSGTSYSDPDGDDTTTPTSAPPNVAIEVWSNRDGYRSWQSQRAAFARRGYAFAYLDDAGDIQYGGFNG